MLLVANSLKNIRFGLLMEVYAEANENEGRQQWPEEPMMRQVMLAEQSFYSYLKDVFFKTPGGKYMIWEDAGRYVSALRIEPYRDGLLLEAVETAPGQRQKGYAAALIAATCKVLSDSGPVKLYAHIRNRNTASRRLHESCGFCKISDYAAYIDGSIDSRACTMCREL